MSLRNLKRFALVALFAGLMIGPRPSFGQEPVNAAASPSTGTEKLSALDKDLLKLNNEMLDAEVRVDMPALDRLFAGDFVRLTLGGFENKTNFLNALNSGRNRFMSYELTDVQIHTYGTIAVLAGGLHLISANGDTQNLFADVWIKEKEGWRMLAWVTNRPAQAGRVIPGDSPVKPTDTAGLGAPEQNLLKANDQLFGALTQADTATLDHLFSPDFFRLTAEGGILNKPALLSDLKTGKLHFEILEPNDVKAHVYGTTALLTGGFRLKDSASDTQNLFLGVWVQQKGQWQTAAWIADARPQPQPARPAAK